MNLIATAAAFTALVATGCGGRDASRLPGSKAGPACSSLGGKSPEAVDFDAPCFVDQATAVLLGRPIGTAFVAGAVATLCDDSSVLIWNDLGWGYEGKPFTIHAEGSELVDLQAALDLCRATEQTSPVPAPAESAARLSLRSQLALRKCRRGLGSDFATDLRVRAGNNDADPDLYEFALVISDCDAAREAIVADAPKSELAKAAASMNSAFLSARQHLRGGSDEYTKDDEKLVQDAVDAFELEALKIAVSVR